MNEVNGREVQAQEVQRRELNWSAVQPGDHLRFGADAPAEIDADLTYTVTELHAGPFVTLRAYCAGRSPLDVTLGQGVVAASAVKAEPWETLGERLPLMVQVSDVAVRVYRRRSCPVTGHELPPPTVRWMSVVTHVLDAEARARARARPVQNLRGPDRYFSAVSRLDESGAATLTLRGEALAFTVLCQVAQASGWPLTLHDDGVTSRVTLAVDTGEGVSDVEAFGPSVQGGVRQAALILARALRLAVELRAGPGGASG